MATKEITAKLLKRLEEGTQAIWKRYEEAMNQRTAEMGQSKRLLEEEYARAASEASARARIDHSNTLEKMADHGMTRTGEAVQATLAANADRNRALSALAVQKARDTADLESEARKAKNELSYRASQEEASLQKEVYEALREQENADREYELAKEELAWKKEESNKKGETAEKQEEWEPSRDPYQYLDSIVEGNTRYDWEKGYRVLNRKGVSQTVSRLLRDSNLSLRYRYELYLYARSLGYLADTAESPE